MNGLGIGESGKIASLIAQAANPTVITDSRRLRANRMKICSRAANQRPPKSGRHADTPASRLKPNSTKRNASGLAGTAGGIGIWFNTAQCDAEIENDPHV